MPRDITVKFSDGTQHVYRGAPDDITPEAVTQRAQQEFKGLSVKSLDGGRSSPAPAKPAPKTAVGRPVTPKEDNLLPEDAKRIWNESSARLEARIKDLPPKIQQQARDKLFASPAIQRLQKAAARKRLDVPAVQRSIKASARQRADQNAASPAGNFLTALKAGITRGAFGIPERVAAAGEAYLPSAITGNESDANYEEILAQTRANTDADLEKAGAGNILGQIASGILTGGPLGKAITGVGGRLIGQGGGRVAAAVARAAPRTSAVAGNVVGGAVGGAAQAAGEGSNVKTGAALGAVGAPVVMGLGKAAGLVARPIGDLLRRSNAGDLLKRFTTATREEMEAAAQAYRDRTGSEPTLFEILPQADRNKLAKRVVGKSGRTNEQTIEAVRRRVANIGPELRETARTATDPRRRDIVEGMADDLETARGSRAPDDMASAETAARSPVDMVGFRRAEDDAIMAPHREAQVADDVPSLFPTTLRRNPTTGVVEEVHSDPEMNDAIIAAAGGLRRRLSPDNVEADITGLSANEIARMISKLAKVDPSATNKGAALRAEERLMDLMEAAHPDAARAVGRMRVSHAARSRMLEGMNEGGMGRTRESVRVENSGGAQKVRNAYDTPEGEQGRFLGQSNALDRDLSGATEANLRTAGDLAESAQTSAALSGNLGDDVAARITGAAQAQQQSGRNLAAVSRESRDEAGGLSLTDIGKMALALNPQSMPATKLYALTRIGELTHLPESRARQIVDMIFSQDPNVTNRAIAALAGAGEGGAKAVQAIGAGIRSGQITEGLVGGENRSAEPEDLVPSAMAEEMPENNEGDVPDNSGEQTEFDSYSGVLENALANEDPEFLDLWQRQTGQESNREQFDEQGNPLRSSAGATGIAQVMPATGPEAAELAGLDWDPEAFETDPAYNELLGMAYMKEMLRRFDGDVAKALAAYNAGPGAVEKYGDVPPFAETQDYVRKIMG